MPLSQEGIVHVTIDPRFSRLLVRQNDFQTMLNGGEGVTGMQPDDLAAYIRTQSLALMSEVVEILEETHWKPWAKRPADQDVIPNRERYKGEVVDAFIFLMNLMLAGGMSMMELAEMVSTKQEKNLQRQIDGYDGKSTKCPGCRRAYDDDAVLCYRLPEDAVPHGFCAQRDEYVNSEGRFFQ